MGCERKENIEKARPRRTATRRGSRDHAAVNDGGVRPDITCISGAGKRMAAHRVGESLGCRERNLPGRKAEAEMARCGARPQTHCDDRNGCARELPATQDCLKTEWVPGQAYGIIAACRGLCVRNHHGVCSGQSGNRNPKKRGFRLHLDEFLRLKRVIRTRVITSRLLIQATFCWWIDHCGSAFFGRATSLL